MGWYKEVKELYLSIPKHERNELLDVLGMPYLRHYFYDNPDKDYPSPSTEDWLVLLKVAVAMGRIKLSIVPIEEIKNKTEKKDRSAYFIKSLDYPARDYFSWLQRPCF